MVRQISIRDKHWAEVESINTYAIFMAYLLMGVRGLGLLVLTWTTVILLGGFVSMLQKKDFWCLTVITLVQTAGVFDFLLKEKSSDIADSFKGLIAALSAAVIRQFKKDKGTSASKATGSKDPTIAEIVLAYVLLVVQLLVLSPVLCLVAVLYLLGLYISAGISLWRLIEHDYGIAEGGENLNPALNVLYSLAVAQGVVFGYKTIYDLVSKDGLVEEVAIKYSLGTSLVSNYLEETVTGCMKDPSFARGRNLITHAVNLLVESKSRHDYISGVIILGTVILEPETDLWSFGRQGLIGQLLTGSASFGHVVQQLLETFGPRSPYSTEIREHAARIVADVAGSIHLEEQFPGGTMIQCVSSLLGTFEEYIWRPEGYDRPSYPSKGCEKEWLLEAKELRYLRIDEIPAPRAADGETQESDSVQGYKGLVVQGLRILQRLAVHEDNCRVISNTQGLLSKIMAPLISDQQLHMDHHDEWSSIAEESLELMSRLMAPPGETGSKLRSEIAGSSQAILANILECSKCQVYLKKQAVKILLDLSWDTISITSGGSNNTMFMGLVLHIFLLPEYSFELLHDDNYYDKMRGSTHLAKRSRYITKLAGAKLQSVLPLQNEASATSMLQSSVAAVIADLTKTSVDTASNITYRLNSVRILEELCRWYVKDDEYLKELKKAMADVMPKVLEEILGCASTSAEIHGNTVANNDQVSAQETDIEKGVVPQSNNGQEVASSSQQQNGEKQHERIKLQEAFISLCEAISDYRWASEFDDLAEKTCLERGISIPDKGFRSLVRYARDLLRSRRRLSRIGD